MMSEFQSLATLLSEIDPAVGVWLAIIKRAKQDAALGDLSALAWLVGDGVEIAARIGGDAAGEGVISFCREVLAQVDAGKVRARWRLPAD